MFTPAIDLNNSNARWEEDPVAAVEQLSTPGLALASAISSLTEFAANDGCTTRMLGEFVNSETGAKSRTGS